MSVFFCDVLVVGAGPAGQAVSAQMHDSSKTVLVVDAGFAAEGRNLVRIRKSDLRARPAKNRGFGIGGTTSKWGGNLVPFTNSEIEVGGLEAAELQSLIPDALEFLHYSEKEARRIYQSWNGFIAVPDGEITEQQYFRRHQENKVIRPASLNPAANVKFIEGIFCEKLESLGEHGVVGHFKTRDESDVTIKAQKVVVSAGGIETLRLLAKSLPESRQANLGKCFSMHLTGVVGVFEGNKPPVEGERLRGQIVEGNYIHLSSVSTPGHSGWKVTFIPLRKGLIDLWNLGFKSLIVIWRAFRAWLRGRELYLVNVDGSHEPNPSSRVTFVGRVANIALKFGSPERNSLMAMQEALVRKYQEEGSFGFFRCDGKTLVGMSHHLGGAMCGPGPYSLVDEDLMVRGFNNLYVCSTAAFPSYSSANPTLFLVQLAIRLGRKLAE